MRNYNSPIRILQVVGGMSSGGLETMIMNWYRNINRNIIQFDFLVHHSEKCFYDDEIEELGGRIYRLSFSNDHNFIKYIKDLDFFFKIHSNEYHVIHGHHSSYGVFYLKFAKKYGIKYRISHSHIASYSKTVGGITFFLLSRFFKKYANIHFACSDAAGKYMYGEDKYRLVNNGIDTNKFKFSYEARIAIRENLNIVDKTVLVHVGRFHDQKNHTFLIDIFFEYKKINENSVLLLIGEGPLQSSIKEKVTKLRLVDSVFFLNRIENVYDYLSASDVFIFPSLYEGLPLTLVEAQSSGLPVLCSSNVTIETRLTEHYHVLPLDIPARKWAAKLVSILQVPIDRKESYKHVRNAHYDCNDVVKFITELYIDYYK